MRKISNDARSLFLSLQSELEALFTPYRYDGSKPATALIAAEVFRQRHHYRQSGLAIVRGGTAANRVSGAKLLGEIKNAGLLTTMGSTSLTAKFTPLGHWYAQAICPAEPVKSTWPIFQRVAALQDAGAHNAGFVPETFILDKGYDQVTKLDLVTLEDRMGFYLQQGMLVSQSDSGRRIGYSVSAEGRTALEAGCPVEPEGLPAYDTTIFDEYSALTDAAHQAIHRLNTQRDNSLYIPLSNGMWPHPPKLTEQQS